MGNKKIILVAKREKTISKSTVYKFDKEGRLIDKYSGKSECMRKNKISDYVFYKLLRGKVLSSDGYYLSQSINIIHLKLAKKSKIIAPVNIENYNIMIRYRDQLILSQNGSYNSRAATRIKQEIIDITNYLCNI